jgi:nicotinamidase-related amidase
MDAAPARLSAADSSLLVIDVQDKLLAAIPQAPALLLNLSFLLDAAGVLGVPALATEQYPKGLGPTAGCVADRLPGPRPAKVVFSCGGVPDVVEWLRVGGRGKVLLAGIETHVCVLQTGLDLLGQGFGVFVAADAVAGRFRPDHKLALRRLERAGAVLTTAETAVFEWVGTAGAPQFKAVSALVQQRAKRLGESAVTGIASP